MNLPNALTLLRLLLVPVLWAAALAGEARLVGIGLAVCFLTDFADGYTARRLGVTSAFGSRFDSIVDGLIGPSTIAWLLLLEPETILDHRLLAATWLCVTYFSLALGLVKFRRFANLHLQSSRIACVAQYAFLVDVFALPPYEPALLYLAAGLGILSSLETTVLQLTRTQVDEQAGSILRAR